MAAEPSCPRGYLARRSSRERAIGGRQRALNDGLRPNTSALLLRVADMKQGEAVLARVRSFVESEKISGQVLYTNLTPEVEQALQAALQA